MSVTAAKQEAAIAGMMLRLEQEKKAQLEENRAKRLLEAQVL
ncbi:unnamed protein product [Protopolystoma xenopodis]|uniref:Uncharacterized protein n=1 Tax=Protopolystoma xenopodis TaxID=117903 RepID=A0A3S5AFM2_9PLAT|nr:unnamed protein product [Protopolystoma xenopodis]